MEYVRRPPAAPLPAAGIFEGRRVLFGRGASAPTSQLAADPSAAEESARPLPQGRATDSARRLAKKEGIDLASLEGSGYNGIVTAVDVRRAAASRREG